MTCWPTVRLTEATVPGDGRHQGGVGDAVWAAVTWVWAEAMLALSRAIWVAEALAAWSVASWAWSLARVAWAWASEALRAVGSTVARVWPGRDRLPGGDVDGGHLARDGEVEVGLAGRLDGAGGGHGLGDGAGGDRLDRRGGDDAGGGAGAALVANQVPTPAPARTTTAAPTIHHLRLDLTVRLLIQPPVTSSDSWWPRPPCATSGSEMRADQGIPAAHPISRT